MADDAADDTAPRAGRIPWLRPEDLDQAQRGVYDAILSGPRAKRSGGTSLTEEGGGLYGPFNAMLFNPTLGQAQQAVGSAIRYSTSLTGRAREIAILEIARHERSDFEWYAHVQAGLAAGLTEAECEGLRTGADLDLDPAEALVRRLTVTLIESRDLDDEQFADAEAGLGWTTLHELISLVGYYQSIALSMRVTRTPLPPGVAPTF